MSVLALLAGVALASPPLLLKAETVHTVSGAVIENGAVLVVDGRIAAVGTASEVDVPEGTRVLEDKVLVPGMIDTWTTAGLTGPMNHAEDQDHEESRAAVQPELRALDAYNPDDALVEWIRGFGVTTINTGPSPGQPVSGRTLLRSTAPSAAPLQPDAFIVFTLGERPKGRFGDDGAASRMGSAALVRQALTDAQEYRRRRGLKGADQAPTDLGMEALVDLLEGRRRAIVHAHRAHDMRTALRIADEFGIDVLLAGAAEGWLIADELAAAGVPVLVGPVMARSWRAGEQRNSSFENAARLTEAGVEVAFMGGYEGYVPKVRVVLWEAAVAGANGLGPERTLRALTLGAAEILGVSDQTGSIDVGKIADLVLYDGDPLEYASHACAVVAAGAVVSDTCR
jgi:imidazolonepropionase-like amidohydrolase